MIRKVLSIIACYGIPIAGLFLIKSDGDMLVTKLAVLPTILIFILLCKVILEVANKKIAIILFFGGLGYTLMYISDMAYEIGLLMFFISGGNTLALIIKGKEKEIGREDTEI